MARLPYAAKVLIGQARITKPRTETTNYDEDGLGVYRTVEFNKATSEWLGPLLDRIGDPRISLLDNNGGKLRVTFVADRHADETYPFPLADAEEVVESETDLRSDTEREADDQAARAREALDGSESELDED